jgi:hypothetical protein
MGKTGTKKTGETLAIKQWLGLRIIKDIREPIRNLAKFGQPKPL